MKITTAKIGRQRAINSPRREMVNVLTAMISVIVPQRSLGVYTAHSSARAAPKPTPGILRRERVSAQYGQEMDMSPRECHS